MSFLSDISPAIDHIIHDLRQHNQFNPSSSKSLIVKSIQFLPSIRNELNIPLLTYEILSSPSLQLPNLVTTDYLIDGFRSVVARKYSITDPTIPPDEWTKYLINPVVERLSNERNLWRSLPLLSGLIQAIKYDIIQENEGKNRNKLVYVPNNEEFHFYQDLYVKILNQIITLPLENGQDYNNHLGIINMSLLSLAKCHWALDDKFYTRLNHVQLVIRSLDLIYLYRDTSVLGELQKSNEAATVSTPLTSSITYNLLGAFSQIIRQSIESNYKNNFSFNNLDQALNQIYTFTEDLIRTLRLTRTTYNNFSIQPNQWPILKQYIFAICLQLQGFSGLLLHVNNPKLVSSTYISSKILRIFSPLYFILEKLGSTSFEPFNFTYNVCIDTLILSNTQPSPIDSLIHTLSGSCNLGDIFNELERGKIIYLIDLFEKLIHFSSVKTINETILPIVEEFLTPKYHYQNDLSLKQNFAPILESSHSVILQYLLLPKEKIIISDKIIINYFNTLLTLFPHTLSSQQFLVALNTISTSVITKKTNLTYEFLDKLYIRCKITSPGLPLRNSEENGPPTIRSVFVSGLIHTLPLLEPIDFQFWLNRAYGLIVTQGPYFSPLFQAENDFLKEDIETMISSELDLSLSDIGIRFWHKISKL